MDATAGISIRPNIAMLCTIGGGEPRVIASSPGYNAETFHLEPEIVQHRKRGFASLIDRFMKPSPRPENDESPVPFHRTGNILQGLRSAAPPDAPHRVSIAVPAWANDVQRQHVAQGARTAGWDVIGIVNEPTAAAMAAGLLREEVKEGKVLVYDLSHQKFDVTILAYHDVTFEVLAADGCMEFMSSSSIETLLEATHKPCERALRMAGVNVQAIDAVVIVGEAARDERVAEHVTAQFGMQPVSRFDPEHFIGIGAAVHASLATRS